MFFEENEFDYNLDISNLGYAKLFDLYLECRELDNRNYILKNIYKVEDVTTNDVISIIKYCAIYNRSYKQIKASSDKTLFDSSYLNNFRILIDLFVEKLNQLDNNNQYITDNNDEYDYFDLIIMHLKEIKEPNLLSIEIYKIFDITILNDLKIFYKLVYTLLTNSYFNTMHCTIIFEVFHLKDSLFEFLLRNNSNIDNIINEINKMFVSIPTVSSRRLNKIKDILETRSICTDKSLTFLSDGYQMLNFYNKNNVFDYSAVSLQFFKVIEIEIKDHIVLLCSRDLNKEELFNGLEEQLSLTTFSYDFLEKLELGKLRYLLRKVKSYMYDIRDEKPVTFINNDIEKFYKRLISLLMNVKTVNFFLDILHHKVVSLYRNSAVHTGILSYERGAESVLICNVFLKNLKQLNYSFKLANAISVNLHETPDFIKELIKNNE